MKAIMMIRILLVSTVLAVIVLFILAVQQDTPPQSKEVTTTTHHRPTRFQELYHKTHRTKPEPEPASVPDSSSSDNPGMQLIKSYYLYKYITTGTPSF